MSKYLKKIVSAFVTLGLAPFSFVWECLYKLRRFFYKSAIFKRYHFEVPIISIGNISFGGTGKTPFTLWLSQYLESKNKKVMILMRGYKGQLEKSHGILKSLHKVGGNPIDFGDEAIMLSRKLQNASIVVGKNRAENLKRYYNEVLADVVLLDDGHQHLKIERALNIVLLDVSMPLSQYKVAPLGFLREGPSSLRDADLIVFSKRDQITEEEFLTLKNFCSPWVCEGIPLVELSTKALGLYDANYIKVFSPEDVKGKKVLAVAAIASPRPFFNLLESLEVEIVEEHSFIDHHLYTVEEIKILEEKAKQLNAIIVMTEKDMVKWRKFSNNKISLYLEMEIHFLSGERELKEKVLRVLK